MTRSYVIMISTFRIPQGRAGVYAVRRVDCANALYRCHWQHSLAVKSTHSDSRWLDACALRTGMNRFLGHLRLPTKSSWYVVCS